VEELPRGLWRVSLDLEGLDGGFAWAPYDSPAGVALRRGKYRPDPGTVTDLGRRLAEAGTELGLPPTELVVPVPRSFGAVLRAGVAPSEVLARAVAKRTSRRVSRVLRRSRGPRQAATRRDLRRLNVEHAYRATTSMSGSSVLLVDDVVTTGATAEACGRALIEAGARSVVLLALCSPAL